MVPNIWYKKKRELLLFLEYLLMLNTGG